MAVDKSINSVSEGMGLEIFGEGGARQRRVRPALTHREAARETPVFVETDVLVIGGGPSGTSAAVAAARLGADVTLVERYNHLGGLSTGGLVIWIDRMTDWTGTQIIAGFARELMDRLPKEAVMGPPRAEWGSKDAATADYWSYRSAAFQNIVTWSPTVDPEALKTLSMQLMVENRIRLTLHALAVQPIVEGNVMRGAIFESKEGRHAVLAKVVIDTSGDADLLTRAGVQSHSDIDSTDIHHCMNTAFMLGGVDMERWTEFRRTNKNGFSDFMKRGRDKLKFFEKPFFSWRPDIGLFMGPRLSGYSAVNVEDLTEVEIKSLAPKWNNISVPYSSLLPLGVEGALGAGRHVACDASSHTFLREIPQCWMTGQAAGVAAALAANSGISPRQLDARLVQRELLKQGAYLSPSVAAVAGVMEAAAE
jgi:hypothetical protein